MIGALYLFLIPLYVTERWHRLDNVSLDTQACTQVGTERCMLLKSDIPSAACPLQYGLHCQNQAVPVVFIDTDKVAKAQLSCACWAQCMPQRCIVSNASVKEVNKTQRTL